VAQLEVIQRGGLPTLTRIELTDIDRLLVRHDRGRRGIHIDLRYPEVVIIVGEGRKTGLCEVNNDIQVRNIL